VFESEELPLSIPEEKIKSGTRDYVRYFNNNSVDPSKFYPLEQVLNYITDDGKRQRTNDGKLVSVYPAKKYSLDVDKQAILDMDFLPARDTGKIVDKMYWNIGRNGLSKGDLIVLDIISTNAKTGWKRPIYWTTTTGSSVYLGLQKYLRNNGLTYQLLPVEANTRMRGMDDMDLLQDKLMNVYEWGNMEKGEMFLDDKAQLVPKNLRSLFIQVADFKSRRNEVDTAAALLDKCFASMPESLLPMNLRLKAAAADIYYRADQIEKADKVLQEVGDDAFDLVNYYDKFKTKGIQSASGDRNENAEVLKNVGLLANRYERTELGEKYTELYNQIKTAY
jgi:hypothetical protein